MTTTIDTRPRGTREDLPAVFISSRVRAAVNSGGQTMKQAKVWAEHYARRFGGRWAVVKCPRGCLKQYEPMREVEAEQLVYNFPCHTIVAVVS